jgi:hypothetical protein
MNRQKKNDNAIELIINRRKELLPFSLVLSYHARKKTHVFKHENEKKRERERKKSAHQMVRLSLSLYIYNFLDDFVVFLFHCKCSTGTELISIRRVTF